MKITYWIAATLIALTAGMNLFDHPVPAPLQNTLVDLPLEASPIERNLFFDWPKPFQYVDEVTQEFGRPIWDTPQLIPQSSIKKIVNTPMWHGFLPQLLGSPSNAHAPWFEKISEGEVWRLATPALLHYELFHLLFNLFWLIILGRLLEERIGMKKYLIITLLIAIGSNTAQYLMTGIRFLGYSGVIAGLFGFIYLHRKKVSYPLPESLFKATFIFIFGMAALEGLFLLTHLGISISIANTAHIAGLCAGLITAKIFERQLHN